MELHPNPTIKLLRAALMHDMAEAELGDLPYTAKSSYWELNIEYNEAEYSVLDKLGLDHKDDLSEDDSRWLSAADMLELLFFCSEELEMGNQAVLPIYQRGLHILHNKQNLPEEIKKVISELHRP